MVSVLFVSMTLAVLAGILLHQFGACALSPSGRTQRPLQSGASMEQAGIWALV
jgi:hypothetical protein